MASEARRPVAPIRLEQLKPRRVVVRPVSANSMNCIPDNSGSSGARWEVTVVIAVKGWAGRFDREMVLLAWQRSAGPERCRDDRQACPIRRRRGNSVPWEY